MASAKQKLWALCRQHGIEIDHRARGPYHHVHLQAPAGKAFSGHIGLDNLSLWDGDDGAPDWASCLRELEDALPLEDDPDGDEEDRGPLFDLCAAA